MAYPPYDIRLTYTTPTGATTTATIHGSTTLTVLGHTGGVQKMKVVCTEHLASPADPQGRLEVDLKLLP